MQAFNRVRSLVAWWRALRTMNQILGGTPTARLNLNLREDKHWSYGSFSFFRDARGQRALHDLPALGAQPGAPRPRGAPAARPHAIERSRLHGADPSRTCGKEC